MKRLKSSSGEVDSESVENSQNEFENESVGDEITENNNKSAESSPGEVTGDEPAESDVPGEPVDNSTENGQEKSPEPDQNNDSLDEKSEKSETSEPQCENVVMENDQQSDNFGDFEEKTDEFDDFGDFQDDNDGNFIFENFAKN